MPIGGASFPPRGIIFPSRGIARVVFGPEKRINSFGPEKRINSFAPLNLSYRPFSDYGFVFIRLMEAFFIFHKIGYYHIETEFFW